MKLFTEIGKYPKIHGTTKKPQIAQSILNDFCIFNKFPGKSDVMGSQNQILDSKVLGNFMKPLYTK